MTPRRARGLRPGAREAAGDHNSMSFLDRFRHPALRVSARDVDPDALDVLHRLQSAGFTAYLVGGGVRDLLLGRTPKDFDVATEATPSQIKKLFGRQAFIIGRRFRLVLVRFGEKQIETATFRRDPGPEAADDEGTDAGRDASGALYQFSDNAFGTPEEDALRRDFTVNALFWDPAENRVIDYVGGIRDLRKKTLRSIGDPNVRFREDPVRMLRAVRLSSRLGFSIHADSVDAIRRHSAELAAASRPRLFEELLRLFTFCRSEEAFRRLYEYGLMDTLVPEVARHVRASGGKRSPLWRYLAALDAAFPGLDTENRRNPRFVQENVLRLAALLAPLWRERLAAAGGDAAGGDGRRGRRRPPDTQELAEDLVDSVVVEPFRTRGWRVPKLMCQDLCATLDSLALYPSRTLHRRSAFSLPWFHTALVFWELCAKAEEAGAAETEALAQWRTEFDAWADGPHPARRGRYVPTRPDSAHGRGFPGSASPESDDGGVDTPVSSTPGETGEAPGPTVPADGDGPAPEKRRRRRRGGRRERLRRQRMLARQAESANANAPESNGSAPEAESRQPEAESRQPPGDSTAT